MAKRFDVDVKASIHLPFTPKIIEPTGDRNVRLTLNLLPNDDGCTLSLRKQRKAGAPIGEEDENVETMQLSYDDELLDYIDNGELPPYLVDIIDTNAESDKYLDLFHCGSVLIEIRDYRYKTAKSVPPFDSKIVRLKPSNVTLINDVSKLTSSFGINQRNWTESEKIALEASLVMATADRLCLDPNPNVAIVANRLQFEKKWMKSSKKIHRLAEKYSLSSINRVKKLQMLRGPKQLNLHSFLKGKSNYPSTSSRLSKSTNNWKEVNVAVNAAPKSVDVEKVAKIISPPPLKTDNGMIKIEEFTMEFMDPEKRMAYTVTMFHRPVDDTYFGQLCVNRSREVPNGSSCLFQFGNKLLKKKYIEQFIDILSENGRKSVKITHHIAGHQPKVTYSFASNVSLVKDPNATPVTRSLVQPPVIINAASVPQTFANPSIIFLTNPIVTNVASVATIYF